MVSRREIEQLILVGLREVRTMERNLNHGFETLATARAEARVAFLSSLQDLERRTIRLERLMEALDSQTSTRAPLAA
jgi:hypothetical protein